ncbi:hypothetical protein ACIP4W_40030 [Streptomyces sp. NPDC088846]|uniref:hypothetical protein n=1 Tax=unclassified Streptomyces TaxID=2593676 RepID=UPI0038009D7C
MTADDVQRAASSGGLVISCRAYFGLGPEGTSDAGRVRDITVAVTPSHAAAILAAQEDGATESDLHDAVAEAIADAYFRQGGGGRAGHSQTWSGSTSGFSSAEFAAAVNLVMSRSTIAVT